MKYIDVFVVLFLGFASLMDIKFKKVSNLYLLFWLVVGMCIKKYEFIISFLVALIFTYIFYYLRFFGAADIKLTAILCGFLGLGESLYIIFIAFILAALYSLYYLFRKKIFFERISYFLHYTDLSIRSRTFYKYNIGLENDLLMPMVPWLLIAFLIWRLYQIIWI